MNGRGASATELPVVLTIAGFDPSSGAGLTADLKTFAAHNCYGVAAVTSITVQNTEGVRSRQDVSSTLLSEQIAALAEDIPLAGAKIGMLGSAANVKAVAAALEHHPMPFVVLDPVLQSSGGAELLDRAGIEALRDRLLPKATVITPNLDEAARLLGQTVQTLEETKAAAEALHRMCGARVVITGGHLEKPQDVFYDGSQHTIFAGDRVRSQNTHGSGCAFSSAIAAHLALGKSLPDSIVLAKAYVTKAIERGCALGRGRGSLNHLYRLQIPAAARAVVPEPAESHR